MPECFIYLVTFLSFKEYYSYFQDGKALPDGPVVISPDGLFPSLYREGIWCICTVSQISQIFRLFVNHAINIIGNCFLLFLFFCFCLLGPLYMTQLLLCDEGKPFKVYSRKKKKYNLN